MKIKFCRCCGAERLEKVLDLGSQPWGNDFRFSNTEVPTYPLNLVVCLDCWTPQIDYTVPKEIMYSDHTYLSSANFSMKEHFDSVATKANELIISDMPMIVDIGSNDGTLLKCFKDKGFKTLGVEPSETTSKIAQDQKIETINSFFNKTVANKILKTYGEVDVVSAANVLYHVEDLHEILSQIPLILKKDGVFVIQGTYLVNLIKNVEFDIIYHEHLLYYYLGNLNYLLGLHSLEIFDVDFSDVHGGSFVVFAAHKGVRNPTKALVSAIEAERSLSLNNIQTYKDFAIRVERLRDEVQVTLKKLQAEGATICAYGAPVKGTVMLNYCKIKDDLIPFAVEINPLKINKFIPNTGIKVLDEKTAEAADYYFVLAWNFIEHFKSVDQKLGRKRKYITPSPQVRFHD